MRLRQVAFVAEKLEPVVDALGTVFGLRVAYRDPAVAIYGLVNAVMPVGGEFLEVVQPVKDDASALRYLRRRGGDAGYMLIFQAPDALAQRARLAAAGVRLIAEVQRPEYSFTHFHPGDFNGVLTSIDTEGDGADWLSNNRPWPPAGRDWKAASAPADVLGILGATVQTKAPEKAAAHWAKMFQARQDGARIVTDRGFVEFVPPRDADGTGVVGLDIAVRDPAAPLARARAAGLPVTGNAVTICGVSLTVRESA